MRDPDYAFLAPRIRAAMAYAGMTRTQAAEAMGTSPGSLDRMTGKKPGEQKPPTWTQVGQLAEAAGLPFEWFLADFDRAGQIPAFTEAAELSRLEAKARLRRSEAERARRTRERRATPAASTPGRGVPGKAS